MKADFEFVVESAPDKVLRVSAEGQVAWVNAEAEDVGYPRRELLGRPLETLLPVRLRETDATLALSDLTARRRYGSEFFVDVSLSPAPAGGVVAIARALEHRVAELKGRSKNPGIHPEQHG